MAIGRYRLVRHRRVGGRQVRILVGEASRIMAGTAASAIVALCFQALKVAVDERCTATPNGVAFRR